MPVTIIDHTSPKWAVRKKNENGAATYSIDIVTSQAKHWTDKFQQHPENVVISTCPAFYDISPAEIPFKKVDLAVQYLHTYPFFEPIGYINRIFQSVPRKSTGFRMKFISAYRTYADRINRYAEKLPISAAYVPMAIDPVKLTGIRQANRNIPKHQKKIIWFGNLYREKNPLYQEIRKKIKAFGWSLDVINRGRYNGSHRISQLQAWELLSNYQYGIGVGRCALEMYVLGLKVLIAGANFGGIINSETDFIVQQSSNFNGRVITCDRDIHACLSGLPDSFLPGTIDIFSLNHVDLLFS